MENNFSLEDVVKFANDIVIVTKADPLDAPGPEIVYVNQAFTDLTGFTPEEVIGKNPRILQGPESDTKTRAEIRAALGRKEPFRTVILNYSKSGRKYWLDINIIPLQNRNGEVTHFAAIESGKIELDKQIHDFNLAVKQQVELNQLLAKKKDITLHMSLSDIPPFPFDQNAMIQVMSNLIGNAIKFSPPKANIFVVTEKAEDRIRFSVRDEGPGLSQEDQELLFKEFQRLSAKPTGGEKSTGLGLAIVKKLIRLHNGEVGTESELGKGSTFFFSLPIE